MAIRRATKIVATLGPASSDPQLLEAMIRAGVNVVRLNFSHGKAQDHIDRAATVRAAAQRAGREVAIMADLQGPKIRLHLVDLNTGKATPLGVVGDGSPLVGMAIDAGCAQAATVQVDVVDDAGRPVAGAVVFLESSAARALVKPLPQAEVAQEKKQFLPGVLVVPVGTQ
eukprot:gene6246-7958_t